MAVPVFPTTTAAAALANVVEISISFVLANARDKAAITVSPAPVTSGFSTE